MQKYVVMYRAPITAMEHMQKEMGLWMECQPLVEIAWLTWALRSSAG